MTKWFQPLEHIGLEIRVHKVEYLRDRQYEPERICYRKATPVDTELSFNTKWVKKQ